MTNINNNKKSGKIILDIGIKNERMDLINIIPTTQSSAYKHKIEISKPKDLQHQLTN